jgi:uncharacterized protein YdhG (YjbR/CyaY superfamily)
MKKTVDSYLNSQPDKDEGPLDELRQTILSVFKFEETTAYGMPAFRYKSKIVASFRNHTNHIGFYLYSGTILKNFSGQLKDFKTSVGSVQFPKGKRLPIVVIKKIIEARMKEIDEKIKSPKILK